MNEELVIELEKDKLRLDYLEQLLYSIDAKITFTSATRSIAEPYESSTTYFIDVIGRALGKHIKSEGYSLRGALDSIMNK